MYNIYTIYGTLFFGTIGYTHYTKFNKTITIRQKYTVYKNKFITDTNNNNYTIDNSLLLASFYSNELWSDIKIGCTYNIKAYGFRIGFFDLYPNIYYIKIDNL